MVFMADFAELKSVSDLAIVEALKSQLSTLNFVAFLSQKRFSKTLALRKQ